MRPLLNKQKNEPSYPQLWNLVNKSPFLVCSLEYPPALYRQAGRVPDWCLYEVVFIWHLGNTGKYLFEVYSKQHKSNLVISCGSFLLLQEHFKSPSCLSQYRTSGNQRVVSGVTRHLRVSFQLFLVSSLTLLHSNDLSWHIFLEFFEIH